MSAEPSPSVDPGVSTRNSDSGLDKVLPGWNLHTSVRDRERPEKRMKKGRARARPGTWEISVRLTGSPRVGSLKELTTQTVMTISTTA